MDYTKLVVRNRPGLVIGTAGLGNLLPGPTPTVDALRTVVAEAPLSLAQADGISAYLVRTFSPVVQITVDAILEQARVHGIHIDHRWLKLKLPILTFERREGRLRVLILTANGVEIDEDQPDYITAPPTLDRRGPTDEPYYDEIVPREPAIGAGNSDRQALEERVVSLVQRGIDEEFRRRARHDWVSGPVDVGSVTEEGATLERAHAGRARRAQ